jgi:hypothetical protein
MTLGEKVEDLIASFRNSYHPRIAVTVDMIGVAFGFGNPFTKEDKKFIQHSSDKNDN